MKKYLLGCVILVSMFLAGCQSTLETSEGMVPTLSKPIPKSQKILLVSVLNDQVVMSDHTKYLFDSKDSTTKYPLNKHMIDAMSTEMFSLGYSNLARVALPTDSKLNTDDFESGSSQFGRDFVQQMSYGFVATKGSISDDAIKHLKELNAKYHANVIIVLKSMPYSDPTMHESDNRLFLTCDKSKQESTFMAYKFYVIDTNNYNVLTWYADSTEVHQGDSKLCENVTKINQDQIDNLLAEQSQQLTAAVTDSLNAMVTTVSN